MFRGVPTPRNAPDTSEHVGLPDLIIPGTNGEGAAFAAFSAWHA